MSKSDRLAAALLADRNRRQTIRDERTVPCFSCGHTFVYRGRRGDLNARFCSMRCQDWYDAGNAPIGRSDPFAIPLRDWRVVAGPPGVEIGSRYYEGMLGDRLTPMKPSGDGYTIKCAGCSKEFVSRGLRCCSVDCDEARAVKARKRRSVECQMPLAPRAFDPET
jgi:hypothetical protein